MTDIAVNIGGPELDGWIVQTVTGLLEHYELEGDEALGCAMTDAVALGLKRGVAEVSAELVLRGHDATVNFDGVRLAS
jgi:hypothetical protein